MKIKNLFFLMVVFFTLSACILKRGTDDASGDTGGGSGGSTTKAFTSSDWVNDNGAYHVDMSATTGTGGTVIFANPGFSCTCTVVLSGSSSSGTYTSSCTLRSGSTSSLTCRYYEAPHLANNGAEECTAASSTAAKWAYSGTTLSFGNCNQTGLVYH